MAFLGADVQQNREEKLHQDARGGGLPTQRTDGFEHPVDNQSDDETECRAADERDDEPTCGLAYGELAGYRGGDGELEADDAGSVIEQ